MVMVKKIIYCDLETREYVEECLAKFIKSLLEKGHYVSVHNTEDGYMIMVEKQK